MKRAATGKIIVGVIALGVIGGGITIAVDSSKNKNPVEVKAPVLIEDSALYEDTRNYFTRAVDVVNDNLGNFKLNDESKRQVVEALLDGRKQWSTLNPYERYIYEAIKGGLELTEPFKNWSVSDLIGGVTNNTVAGQSMSIPSLIATGGMGHGRDGLFRNKYWYDGNNATYQLGKEFFAEYMSYSMTGQREKLSELRQVFPNACAMMERLYETGGMTYTDESDDERFGEIIESITDSK